MKKNKILLTSILLLPVIVNAKTSALEDPFTLAGALFMEAFVTMHMSAFVLSPLSKLLCKDGNSKKLFWKMFFIRVIVLLFFDFFVSAMIAMVDFFAVFIGAFIIVPALTFRKISKEGKERKIVESISKGVVNNTTETRNNIIFKCPKCQKIVKPADNYCYGCGIALSKYNLKIEVDTTNNKDLNDLKQVPVLPPEVTVSYKDFDPIFTMDEDKMLEEFIKKELKKANIEEQNNLLPQNIINRKKVLSILFSLLIFISISSIFFHFPIYLYIAEIIILLIFKKLTKNYTLIKYLKKQLKARPSEKISNIVMNTQATFNIDNSKTISFIGNIIAITLSLVLFINPRIMYEKTDNGYAVRYYTFGITNFTKATIPESYKNEKVVSLRGNTFSNMPFLKEVILPDTITEIRGQAFKNNKNLVKVNIPTNLEYLGGGAFYNCTKITNIVLPDTLTYLGGEAFYNNTSLQSIKLSNNLEEIRGNTFENCTSLTSIIIPDSVKRIGGHAFYGNRSLSNVTISPNSSLNEIGSSAFRQCYNLYNITIPNNTYVNSRAFKESPTNITRYTN